MYFEVTVFAQNISKIETGNSHIAGAFKTVSGHSQYCHGSPAFPVWVQGHGEWANMTLNALCKS